MGAWLRKPWLTKPCSVRKWSTEGMWREHQILSSPLRLSACRHRLSLTYSCQGYSDSHTHTTDVPMSHSHVSYPCLIPMSHTHVSYPAVLEPKSQNEVPHEAVDLEPRAVPLALSLVDAVELGEGSDLHRLHHVWCERLHQGSKYTLTYTLHKHTHTHTHTHTHLCSRALVWVVEWMQRME